MRGSPCRAEIFGSLELDGGIANANFQCERHGNAATPGARLDI